MCHLAAGSRKRKDFHTGANEKQLIYLLIYKCVCVWQGEGGSLQHAGQHTGSIQRKNKAATPGQRCWVGVITLWCWLRRKFSCLRELFRVRGLGLCLLRVALLQKRLLNFIRWPLVSDNWKNQLWLQGQWVLQVLEGEMMVLL